MSETRERKNKNFDLKVRVDEDINEPRVNIISLGIKKVYNELKKNKKKE